MRAPSDAAKELMANKGVVPGSLMAPVAPVVPATTASGRDRHAGAGDDTGRAAHRHTDATGHGDSRPGDTGGHRSTHHRRHVDSTDRSAGRLSACG